MPDLSVAVQDGEECVRDFLDGLSCEEGAASHLVFWRKRLMIRIGSSTS